MVTYIAIVVIVAVAAIIVYRKRREKAVKEMPQGLQIFDENGSIIYDYSNETFHIFGTGNIVGGVSGSITDSRIRANDTILLPLNQTLHNFDVSDYNHGSGVGKYKYQQKVYAVFPNITVADGKISWSFRAPADQRGHYVDVSFVYGGRLF